MRRVSPRVRPLANNVLASLQATATTSTPETALDNNSAAVNWTIGQQ